MLGSNAITLTAFVPFIGPQGEAQGQWERLYQRPAIRGLRGGDSSRIRFIITAVLTRFPPYASD
jgi:hypothetical protein